MIEPGRCTIVAEAGVNHDGDEDRARLLVDAAADAGADVVKFQLFRADEVAAASAPKAGYQLETTPASESQLEMLRGLELQPEAFARLFVHARARGLEFLCTCYSAGELDLLEEIGVEAFKFASAQIVELPLLAHAARKGRLLIVSTGMAAVEEIDEALATIRTEGDPPVCLLQCTTSYPSLPEDANLRAMETLARQFGVPVGYSDHTVGDAASVAAAALGAALVEKHLTLDRSLRGPDHAASLDPDGFAAMVTRIREAEAALGSEEKRPSAVELENAAVMRRSLHAAVPIPAGTTIREEHVAMKRPNDGLPPRSLPEILGAVAKQDIEADAPLTPDLFV
jgi:N-acetylneuraminate synthase/N,N'-diacetyllegionaminate synthase